MRKSHTRHVYLAIGSAVLMCKTGKGALTWPKLLTLLNEFYLIFSMLMCSLHHSPSDQVQNGRIFAKNIVF